MARSSCGRSWPAHVGVEPPDRCAGEPSLRLALTLIDERLAAMQALGLDQLQAGIGEHRVVAVGGEQFAPARRPRG